MSGSVLDASALLAMLKRELGAERVAAAIQARAAISTVNLSEVVAKLAESGRPAAAIRGLLGAVELGVFDFDRGLAYQTGLLRPLTRQAGLSLGDRACVALARHLALPVLTTDRAWQGLQLGVTIQVIR